METIATILNIIGIAILLAFISLILLFCWVCIRIWLDMRYDEQQKIHNKDYED